MRAANEYDTKYAFAIGLNGEMLDQGNASRENLSEPVKLHVELEDLLQGPPITWSSGAAKGGAICITAPI